MKIILSDEGYIIALPPVHFRALIAVTENNRKKDPLGSGNI